MLNPSGKLRKAHFEIIYSNSVLFNHNFFNSNIDEAKIMLHSINFFSSGISIKQTIGNTYDYFEARTNDQIMFSNTDPL